MRYGILSFFAGLFALVLTGCATGGAGGVAVNIQDVLKQIVTEPLNALKADANARLQTIDAQVAAGRMAPATAALRRQCSQNIVAFVDGVQSQIGMQIPEGAGIVWMMGIVNDMQGQELDNMRTQVKLLADTCKDQFNIRIF